MINFEIVNENNLPIPPTLSTSFENIYTDSPPTVFQGSTKYYCDQIFLAVKACDQYADFQYYVHQANVQKMKSNRCKIYANAALSKFTQLQKKSSYKYLEDFKLVSIQFHLSNEFQTPRIESTNLLKLFCVHRKLLNSNLNIIYVFEQNLFSVLGE